MNNQFISDENLSCPLCKSKNVEYFSSHTRVKQDLYCCKGCKFYFIFPHVSYIPSLSDNHDLEKFEFWGNNAAHIAYNKWRESENQRIVDLSMGELQNKKCTRLLEIGFGEGPLTKLLVQEVGDYWGIEPVPATFKKTSEVLKLEGKNVFCVKAEHIIDQLPFSKIENYFDIIIMVSVFEHLSNPAEIISCCSRMLVPGGHLILSTPNSGCFRWLHAMRKIGRLEPWSCFHISFFSENNLKLLFRDNGFLIEEAYRAPLINALSIDYFVKLTGVWYIGLAMKFLKICHFDRLFSIDSLIYKLQKSQ